MNISVNVICRKDKINKSNSAPVHIRFTQNRKIRYISKGVTVNIEDWDFERNEVKRSIPDAKHIHFQIETKLQEYEKRIKRLDALDMAVTLDNVLETNGRKVNCTVAEFFSRVIKQLESVEKYGSVSKHRYCLSLLSQFRSTDVRFDEIDYSFLTDFETFLINRGNKSNSIATKFTVLKSVYNKAIAEGIFVPKINPFLKFKIGRLWKPTRKRAITEEDVHKLITLELPDNRSPNMELGRDVFCSLTSWQESILKTFQPCAGAIFKTDESILPDTRRVRR